MLAGISIWTWVFIGGGALFLLYLLNKTAFWRTKDAIGGQVGKLGHAIWAQDPIAVKNAEIDRKAEDLADATKGLETCRALISTVARQVKSGTTESNRLAALASQYVREGNDDKAREKLVEKARVDKDMADNQAQLVSHQETYDAWLIKIQHANKRINELRREAKSQGVRLQMSKAEANLARLSEAMGKANVSFDQLDEVNEEIEFQIEHNQAKGQVSHDLAREGLEEIEAEQRAHVAQADDALVALKKDMGVAVK